VYTSLTALSYLILLLPTPSSSTRERERERCWEEPAFTGVHQIPQLSHTLITTSAGPDQNNRNDRRRRLVSNKNYKKKGLVE
jgi:hypothetical protein